MQHSQANISAVILAGGKARRMQERDKGLVQVQGRTLIEHVIRNVSTEVQDIIISANRNIDQYQRLGYPVYQDSFGHYAGPLAGIMTALDKIDDEALLLVLPCDMPNLPHQIVPLLNKALCNGDADICCISNNGRIQPLLSLMHARVRQNLHAYLQSGKHKVLDWVDQLDMLSVDVDIDDRHMLNINTAEALAAFAQQADQ